MPYPPGAGKYTATIVNKAVTRTKNGHICFEAQLELQTTPPSHIRAFMMLTKNQEGGAKVKNLKQIENLSKALEWNGTSLCDLQALNTDGVEVRCTLETDPQARDPKYPLRVAWINPMHADRALPEDQLAALDMEFGNMDGNLAIADKDIPF